MVDQSDAILKRLLALHPKLIDLSLDRITTLLADLGNPQKKLPPVIHVAGTNGKGSVVAFMRAVLEAAGLAVHCYTSPHLVHFHERIRLAGTPIADDHLTALLEECENINAGRPITFFEITTAAAFLAFSREPADVVLLETGLGGRLDATNVIDKPALTVITPIDMDHEHFLGTTIEAIAAEKAGIIKPGVPCVSALQRPKAAKVLINKAEEQGADLLVQDRDWSVDRVGQAMVVQAQGRRRNLSLPNLIGDHQIRNAGLAIAALFTQKTIDIPGSAFNAGLTSADWPARMQHLESGALADLLGPDQELWLDGGHNRAAALAIHAQCKAWNDKPLHFVVGILKSRQPMDFLGVLAKLDAKATTLTIPGEENAWPAKSLSTAAIELDLEATTAESLEEAIKQASHTLGGPGRILVCGSLYLCGRALALNAQ